jgi:kynureninase
MFRASASMIDPAALATHYSRFRVADRILLTGHSHQAWPDVGFEAQQQAWLDAARFVDDKWPRNLEQAQRVREGFARLLGDEPANIALGQNTHELVVRWLSALPLRDRPRIVTTDGEFRSIRRQLKRLAEEGWPVIVVPARPVATLAERLAQHVDERTGCVMVSSVLFDTAEIVPELDVVAAACRHHGASMLVDAYHHLNVIPFDLTAMKLEDVFVTGGGYKYCELGEGNCFLRVPSSSRMRPVVTGWYAELSQVDTANATEVGYEPGAGAFAGATYDPTSHYRAAAVFAFFASQQLTADRLRSISRKQVTFLKDAFESLDLNPGLATIEPMPDERRGGFLAIRTPRAADVARALREEEVFVDARGDILRVGPAPYVRDDQLRIGIDAIGRALRGAGHSRPAGTNSH